MCAVADMPSLIAQTDETLPWRPDTPPRNYCVLTLGMPSRMCGAGPVVDHTCGIM
jgi:hypothetical protein